jgi:hypothetical protein
MMSIEEIKQAVENREYGYIGIRCEDGVSYNVGDHANESRVWIDGEATEDTVGGTSCIGINRSDDVDAAMDMIANYFGDRLYLVAGDSFEYGEDEGEYIIRDAVVVAIVR